MATEQQPILMILSTDKENEYPKYIKLAVIPKDNQYFMKKSSLEKQDYQKIEL